MCTSVILTIADAEASNIEQAQHQVREQSSYRPPSDSFGEQPAIQLEQVAWQQRDEEQKPATPGRYTSKRAQRNRNPATNIRKNKITGKLPAGRHQPSCTQHTLLPLGTRSHVLAYRIDTHIPARSSHAAAILLYEPPGGFLTLLCPQVSYKC